MVPGDMLSGWAAFDAWDYLPFNDNAYVRISDSSGNQVQPWYKDVSMVGDYNESPWERWSWTATATDTYTLELGIANAEDSILDSYALFDTNKYTPIPEPSTICLLGGGLFGLLGIVTRNRRKQKNN
jgi:hypothetical protein